MLGRFTFNDYEMGIPPLDETMGLPPRRSRLMGAAELRATMQAWVGVTASKAIN